MYEIRTYEDALVALDDARTDVEADMGEDAVDAAWSDIVSSVAHQIEDDNVALEFVRTQLGYVPFDLTERLGNIDWVV